MRVDTVDGLFTLFYDRSKELWNQRLDQEWFCARFASIIRCLNVEEDDVEAMEVSDECKEYMRERFSWQQVIVVEGVTEIPEKSFYRCRNIKRVIFADTVIRIERFAFNECERLVSIKLSLRLEYIEESAFSICNLSSVFVPPSCRNIGPKAFFSNRNLTILNVSQDTELGTGIISFTELRKRANFNGDFLNTWLKNINRNDQFDLHRVCSSFEPTLDMIVDTMMDKGGLSAFKVENGIGITPSQYLKENPFASVKEMEIIQKYFLKMIGEL